MKKSISFWSFVGKSVKESMKLAKEAGFDGIELTMDDEGASGLTAAPEYWADIKSYAEELDIAIPSVATGLFWSYPFTSNDAKVREKAMTIGEKLLEMAKALNADTALVIPGAVDVVFIPGFEVVPYDVVYDRALEAITRLKVKAEELQVHIGIENVWNQFLLSPLEMRDFIDKVNSPYVGSYFDVGNVVASGHPEQWIKILGKRIRKVHFKDFRREAGNLSGFVDLLAGDVNWPAVMEAFKSIGYDGWATAEMIPPYKHHSDQIIRNTYGAMKSIIG